MSLVAGAEQSDFSLGMFPGRAPHLIPSGGVARLSNFIMEDDGSLYARRGSVVKSAADFGSSGLRFLWDGVLAGGPRTLFANGSDFAVLDSNDSSVVTVGGSGLTRPQRPAVKDGILYVGSDAYGGSRKTATYSTGTLAVTAGSTAVVGTGTTWSASNVDVGMVLVIAGRAIAVRTRTDNTNLVLQTPWPGATASGLSYVLYPIAPFSALTVLPTTSPDAIAVAGQRLLIGEGDKLYESSIGDAALGIVGDPTAFDQVADVWQIPDGVSITAIAQLGDSAIVFTTGGTYAVSNLAYSVLDDAGNLQQRLEKLSADMILWDAPGIASWEDQIAVPCIDGLWLLSTSSQKLVSRSISPLWREYVRLGYRLGNGAIFRSHYIVPVLDASNDPIDLLVCRLDRPTPVRGFGDVWPWSRWAGSAAEVAGVAVRVGTTDRQPDLLGASLAAAGRVIEFAPLKPDGPEMDHDDTAPVAEIVTRDFGPFNRSLVKRLKLWYELLSADDSAVVTAGWGNESRPGQAEWDAVIWDEFEWASSDELFVNDLGTEAPVNNGSSPFVWTIGKRCQWVRFRVRCATPASRFVVRSIQAFVRPSGRM